MLKDDGIKSKIIKQYLPFLNKKVNDMLDSLNLWITLKLDEDFNVEMYSPNRKGQEIADLSSGQLRRIDLAIMMGWREVANARASVDTNLLILDEVLENLSPQGVSDFLEYMKMNYPDTCLFVASQRKDEFSEYFDNIIEFKLKDEFTEVVYGN